MVSEGNTEILSFAQNDGVWVGDASLKNVERLFLGSEGRGRL
jgi:hypothetical protein